MKKATFFLYFLPIVVLLFVGCGGDDDDLEEDTNMTMSSCEFIGQWCHFVPSTNNCLTGVELEFRENGELLLQSTTFFTWESDDCMTIDVINTPTGIKSAEYNVIEVTDSTLTIDIGVGASVYNKVQ